MPKARRALRNIQHRLIYTILLSISASTSAVAQDSDLLDCNAFSFEGVTYDLKSLASERKVTRTRDNPPSTMEDELRFNICEDLALKDDVPAGDQVGSIRLQNRAGSLCVAVSSRHPGLSHRDQPERRSRRTNYNCHTCGPYVGSEAVICDATL
jgi:Autophagy-related protein 27